MAYLPREKRLVKTVTGIDLTNLANTTLIDPLPANFLIDTVVLVCESVTGPVDAGSVQIQDGSANILFTSTSIGADFLTAGRTFDCKLFATPDINFQVAQGGSIVIQVGVPSGSATLVATAHVFGTYLE